MSKPPYFLDETERLIRFEFSSVSSTLLFLKEVLRSSYFLALSHFSKYSFFPLNFISSWLVSTWQKYIAKRDRINFEKWTPVAPLFLNNTQLPQRHGDELELIAATACTAFSFSVWSMNWTSLQLYELPSNWFLRLDDLPETTRKFITVPSWVQSVLL